MKYLKTSMLGAALCFCLLHTSAQNRTVPISEPNYNKPRLFDDLPQRMQLRLTNLESLFSLVVGSTVKTQIADNFTFQGVVVSKADNAQVQSVVIKSVNRQGATLTFTKTIKPDGSFSYIGRIISFKHGDAYDITQENGQFILQKKNFNDLVNE